MTRFSTLLAIASVITGNLFATTTTQYVNLQVTENTNVTVQQTQSVLLAFEPNGMDALTSSDSTNPSVIDIEDNYAHPYTFSDHNDVITQYDSRPELTAYTKIGFGFLTKFPAQIKVYAYNYANSPDTTNRPAYMWIEEIASGTIYPLLGDTVKLNIPANINFNLDYYLHTGPALPKSVVNETCYHMYDGSISITNPHISSWDLQIFKGANLFSYSHINQPDTTIGNLTAGNYMLYSYVNNTRIDSTTLVVTGAPQIIPDFVMDNYTPTTADLVNFTNYTTGAYLYSWDFGDGYDDTLQNTTHEFLTPGNYAVTLEAVNSLGCFESFTDSIFVSASIHTTITPPQFAPSFNNGNNNANQMTGRKPDATTTNGSMRITINQSENQLLNVELVNLNGQVLSSTASSDTTFELSAPQAGIYIVKMTGSNGELTTKTVLITN